VGQKKLGITDNSLVRGGAPLGGGVALRGGICGALTGGIVFLGSLLGKDEPEKMDDPTLGKACNEFYKRFENEVAGNFGSVNCRDIAKVDWRDPEQVKAFREGDGRKQCAKNTGRAALILGEILEKYVM
jgi:C_GCAxxG_C_C family probable redox protein